MIVSERVREECGMHAQHGTPKPCCYGHCAPYAYTYLKYLKYVYNPSTYLYSRVWSQS